MLNLKTVFYLGITLFAVSCSKKDEKAPVSMPKTQYPFSWDKLPSNFPPMPPLPPDNPQTKEGVELGRRLFYDVALSGANNISCASCHLPNRAFADTFALTNIGASGQRLFRHTPALINIAWMSDGLFWDGGAKNIESLVVAPITNPHEMNQKLNLLADELRNRYDYASRFAAAFPDKAISSQNIMKALAQFQRTLISANSRYDRYKRNEGVQLTSLELQGMELFSRHCSRCHSTDLFTDNLFHNNGLDSIFSTDHEGQPQGRGRVTFSKEDIGKFKTPTLRNIAITSPYMHDGRFATLSDVLRHYRSGIVASPTLDTAFIRNGRPVGIRMTDSEANAIIAFLETLTDHDFLQNEAISNPF